MPAEPLGLWEGYGVEIELMIVDAATLDVASLCDRLMERVVGEAVSEVDRGALAWSNELALHVVELKTNGPAASLHGLAAAFQESVRTIATELRPLGARLMPGGMHPWMDPASELRLWPHEYNDVYRAFDRIFSCRGHGWANLQSTHLNLPFRGGEEFRLLHEAIRLVLPIIPALSAASPVLDGRPGPALDNRLLAYRDNARRVPSVTGRVVPESVESPEAYQEVILERIYNDLAPLDPEGVLEGEWVNARGAIARFQRGAIEVRVVDAQECPVADLAVTAAVAHAVRRVVERLAAADAAPLPTDLLADVLDRTLVDGERTRLVEPAYLERLGLAGAPTTAGEAWAALLAPLLEDPAAAEWHRPLRVILERGPLARRVLEALGAAPGRSDLERVWTRLCEGLEVGEPFLP
ncbi:MAG: glutamate--cysteine ligase [Gemmatimonadetes bacterium]|nr:glutamate--cysteine ligase [Gemmatimonadota bacterium]